MDPYSVRFMTDEWPCSIGRSDNWQGKPEVFGENLLQCHLIHHKYQKCCPGNESDSVRGNAGFLTWWHAYLWSSSDTIVTSGSWNILCSWVLARHASFIKLMLLDCNVSRLETSETCSSFLVHGDWWTIGARYLKGGKDMKRKYTYSFFMKV